MILKLLYAERIEKMGSKKANRPYVPENLEYLATNLMEIQGVGSDEKEYKMIAIDGLESAIKALPKELRERVEKYWGLTGGINHSKKSRSYNLEDKAYILQRTNAIAAVRELFRIDYMYMYDMNVKKMIEFLSSKISRSGMNVSDVEAVKYLIAFLVILDNGPKMSFETDPLAVDTKSNPKFTFDEYSIIRHAYKGMKDSPATKIQLRLIYDMLDMLDFNDMLAIKKSFCIEVPKSIIPEGFSWENIQPMYSFEEIRTFKERVFSYGGWKVVDELVLGDPDGKVSPHLDSFMEYLDSIRKDWSKISEFKVGKRNLRTPHEYRELDVYDIGGLQFTDIYEVMFLYVERNLIATEN